MNTYQLNNGVEIPVLGFGTFKAKDGEEAYRAVLEALKLVIVILIRRRFIRMKKVLVKQSKIAEFHVKKCS
ncbi:2,5-diketo-D-gluconic acid reductase A [Streptococcus pneumoniae]|nr:2,5-diketo-D-gluconic acid reductase A [Streptococcus pneumoniae]